MLPVVVTILGEREIVGQKDDTEDRGVLVICSDDMRKAMDVIERPVDTDELFKKRLSVLSRPNFVRNGIF